MKLVTKYKKYKKKLLPYNNFYYCQLIVYQFF